MNTQQYQKKREGLLSDMSEINRMQKGSLTEEYRDRIVDGEVHRTGPYFKYQLWKDGKNISKRVKAEEAEHLQEGIDGLNRFRRLCEDYVETTVAMTEQLQGQSAGKKNSS